ncbi:Eco57I restriction-modification methylase domain-containing protein [Pseudomonas sp. SST3]|uniref:Eco57I restriction-modification methylase domain-containing protein n=1 Tax=Pseudomonas sp. SST3 TaxID=2267882 RepID=UPI00406C1C53
MSRRPFHWPLEFPEVFSRGAYGFNAIIGNPPFLGGQKISGVAGDLYREYLVCYLADGIRGSADLVSYFFNSSFFTSGS